MAIPLPTTHVLLVIDRSGSMHKVADDVRGGYNAYLDSLIRDLNVQYRVTVALFSGECPEDYRLLVSGRDPAAAPRLDEHNYQPGGMTALLDAVGRTIDEFERSTDLAEGDRVLLVVQTDGRENRSREYSQGEIKSMIQKREATGIWGAIFMGAGPDTWQQAGGMGFSSTVSYDTEGTRDSYAGMTRMSAAFSRGGTSREAVEASGLTVRDAEEQR